MDLPRLRKLVSTRFTLHSLLQWGLALVVSLMLWIAAIGEREFSVVHVLPVAPPELPAGLTVLLPSGTDSVRVAYSGSGVSVLWDQITGRPEFIRLLYSVPTQPVEYPYAVSRGLAGEEVVFTGRTYGALGATTFSPASVSMTIDREVTRRVPVKVMSLNGLPERYYWQCPSQDSVSVTGAASLVMRIDSCRTEGIQPDVGDQTAGLLAGPGVERCYPMSVSAALVAPVPVVVFSPGP